MNLVITDGLRVQNTEKTPLATPKNFKASDEPSRRGAAQSAVPSPGCHESDPTMHAAYRIEAIALKFLSLAVFFFIITDGLHIQNTEKTPLTNASGEALSEAKCLRHPASQIELMTGRIASQIHSSIF